MFLGSVRISIDRLDVVDNAYKCLDGRPMGCSSYFRRLRSTELEDYGPDSPI
jgi:hypothetical protein